jgi:hypothetical protein
MQSEELEGSSSEEVKRKNVDWPSLGRPSPLHNGGLQGGQRREIFTMTLPQRKVNLNIHCHINGLASDRAWMKLPLLQGQYRVLIQT